MGEAALRSDKTLTRFDRKVRSTLYQYLVHDAVDEAAARAKRHGYTRDGRGSGGPHSSCSIWVGQLFSRCRRRVCAIVYVGYGLQADVTIGGDDFHFEVSGCTWWSARRRGSRSDFHNRNRRPPQ